MKVVKKVFGIIALVLAVAVIAGAFMQVFGKGKVKPSEWFKSSTEITQPKDGVDGKDGETPYIGESGNWFIGDTDTGVKAAGQDGADGVDGVDGVDGQTPYIGENGNWFIGDTDTGVKAAGQDGADGIDGTVVNKARTARINVGRYTGGYQLSEFYVTVINPPDDFVFSIEQSAGTISQTTGLNYFYSSTDSSFSIIDFVYAGSGNFKLVFVDYSQSTVVVKELAASYFSIEEITEN